MLIWMDGYSLERYGGIPVFIGAFVTWKVSTFCLITCGEMEQMAHGDAVYRLKLWRKFDPHTPVALISPVSPPGGG